MASTMATAQQVSCSLGPHQDTRRDSLLKSGVLSGVEQEELSREDAIEQLLENRENDYQRYVAARAVRAIKESDDEKPSTGTFRQLTRQAGGQERWRRGWSELLRAVDTPCEPDLPEALQSPLPPHSRWLMSTRSNVIFNVFTRTTNPVEDFYLTPLDDMWRSHRYGVYGLRYRHYPNPGTVVVPRDGAGLYYRPNRKILENSDSAKHARRPGVVTLEHVKRVASRAVGQFFPRVHSDAAFFDVWPRIDEVLGCAIEYFHHYFELRRLEETMAQLECRLYNSTQLDGRRRRMDDCVNEFGRIYSTYLLGYGLAFHHLQQGSGYKSAAASDRQIFEALNAYVAQCVWIVYRRPNVTVILRELGRLFRTTGFDPSRRAVPLPLDPMPSVRTLVTPAKSKSAVGKTASKQDQEAGECLLTMSEKRLGAGERRGALGGSMSGSSRRGQSEAASRKGTAASGGQRGASSSGRFGSGRSRDSPIQHSGSRATSEGTSARRHAGKVPSGVSESTPKLRRSDRALNGSARSPVSPSAGSQPAAGDGAPAPEHRPPSTPSTAACEQPPTSPPTGADGGNSAPTSVDSGPSPPPPPSTHVSMKKVYGLYTGPPPPQCAVYGLLRNTSPLLRQSMSRRPPEVAADEDASLRVDRSRLGILGTPLQNYDDVLAAIDYEREEKQRKLKFLSSTRAGASRVAGVVPYLLLPSKFFSPDA